MSYYTVIRFGYNLLGFKYFFTEGVDKDFALCYTIGIYTLTSVKHTLNKG